MRVFITGATGFIGSYLVPELVRAGHDVVGLSRSEAGADALRRARAEVVRGDVNDLEGLCAAAAPADAIIHAAFNHDFGNTKASSESDRRVIEALGSMLGARTLIVTSGTGLVRAKPGFPSTETDGHVSAAEFPRAATEEAAGALIARGARVMVMRLPQVHDTRRQGRLSLHIELAKKHGRVAYVGAGANRVSAVHVSDAVTLYRLALERGTAGARYHAVGEEGVTLRAIAEAIGARLRLPVVSLEPAAAREYFGPLAGLVSLDLAASSAITRQQLGWTPTGPDLLTDLRAADSS